MFSTEHLIQDFLGFFKKLFLTFWDFLLRPNLFIKNILSANNYYTKPTLFLVITLSFIHYFFLKGGIYNSTSAGGQFISNIGADLKQFSLYENVFFAIPLVLIVYLFIKLLSNLFSKLGDARPFYKLGCYSIGSFFLLYLILYYCILFYQLSINKIYQTESAQFQIKLISILSSLFRYLKYSIIVLVFILTLRHVYKIKKKNKFLNNFIFVAPFAYMAIFFLAIKFINFENYCLEKYFPLNTIDFQSKIPSSNEIDFEVSHINDSTIKISTDLIVSNNSEFTCFIKSESKHQLLFHDGNYRRNRNFPFFNNLDFRYKTLNTSDSSFFVLKPYETKPISFESHTNSTSLDSSIVGINNQIFNCYVNIQFESLNPNFGSFSSTRRNLLINGLEWFRKTEETELNY